MGKTLPARRPPIDPAALVAAARRAAPHAPPAVAAAGPDKAAMLSVRMMESTLESVAREARAAGQSQRKLIARALLAAGIAVSPVDLEDRPPARRRGGDAAA